LDSAKQTGVSRWPSLESGLKINNIRALNNLGRETSQVSANEELNIEISILAEESGQYDVYFVIY